MGTITISQICDAVRDTLEDAVDHVHSYDELKEGMSDPETLQVYPQTLTQSAANAQTGTDRFTFQAGVRDTNIDIHADYYAKQRGHIGEDMAVLVAGVDSIISYLEIQDTKPYFGLTGLKAFTWRAERVTFEYGENLARYVGMRFVITFRVF